MFRCTSGVVAYELCERVAVSGLSWPSTVRSNLLLRIHLIESTESQVDAMEK